VSHKIFSVDWDLVRSDSALAKPPAGLCAPETDAAKSPLADPHPDDPFFALNPDSTWNACIRQQGEEENYLDGYMEAAIQLAGDVIDKRMYEKRDTLVLPILYNARHAVELALKFVIDRLEAAGLIARAGRPNHDIKVYWDRLDGASLGDEKLRQTINALKPFVDNLYRIDSDGQELRYHLKRSGDPSLPHQSLINLQVVRASLCQLSDILSVLRNRALLFIDERGTDACTDRCSRRDLLTIAQLLPCRDSWEDAGFDKQKASVKTRYNLSDSDFSEALTVIQSNREWNAILGVETELLHISDDEVVWVVDQWQRLHRARAEDDQIIAVKVSDRATLLAMLQDSAAKPEVIAEVEMRIVGDKLAELEAMFYLGRDRLYPENHKQRVERARKEHAVANDPRAKIVHLIDKINFLHCLQQSALKLGRLSLANRLSKM
jgi:hypothetical protein